MISLKGSVKVLLSLIAAAPLVAAAGDVRIDHYEPLADLVLSSDASGMQKPGVQSVTGIRFNAFSRQFDIELQPNYALLGAAERHNMAGAVQMFRGALANAPDSWARIVLVDGVPQGLLFDGSEMYAIEPIGADGTNAMIFRLADVFIDPSSMSCAEARGTTTAAGLYKVLAAEGSGSGSQGPGATSEMDIGIVADFEFTSDKGSATQAEIITRMNNIDGIFSSQLGVQLNVSRVDAFTDQSDPFSDESDPGLLLDEVVTYRSGTPGQRASGLTHLFTGRDLDGTTVGIAYNGALCMSSFGAGLTQGTHSVTVDTLIAAHELGHNFGAPHDGTTGSPCESTPQDFLMAPRVSSSDQFSACSITQMQDDIDRASCITALAGTDIRVLAGAQPGSLLLGNSANVSFDVNSSGTDEATGVTLDVTIPAGLTLDNVTTTVGGCTSGGGTASCSIGTLAAGSGATVTLGITSTAVGSRSINATGSADVDANANNNLASLSVTVDPAVDLVATAPVSAQVQLDQSMTLRPTIENRSSLTASNVQVTITPSAGLQVDGGTWAAGSCSVVNAKLECSAASMSPNATSTLSVQATAIAEGAQSYLVAVSADETDRDTLNNEDAGQVSVGNTPPPNPSDDDGGSGSMGLGGLFVLLGLAAIRRRTAPFRL